MCLIEMLSCVCRLHVLVVNCDDFFFTKEYYVKIHKLLLCLSNCQRRNNHRFKIKKTRNKDYLRRNQDLRVFKIPGNSMTQNS